MSAAATSRALSIRSIDQPLESKNNQTPVTAISEQSMQERLQQLAYTLWEKRGYPEGSPETDWAEAESQLQMQGNPAAESVVREIPKTASA